MKIYFLSHLEKYLRREGLSAFLPINKEDTLFSITTLLMICVCVGAITILYGKSFVIGLTIPVIVFAVFLLLLITYMIVRALWEIISNREKFDSNSIDSYFNAEKLGGWVIVSFLIGPTILVGIYTSSWLSMLVTLVALLLVLLFSGTYLFSRGYLIRSFIEIVVQAFKGWALSWQAVLATMPLLLVAILLSLFSGDLWNLLAKVSTTELTVLSVFMYIPVFFAIFARIDLTDLISHPLLANSENIVDRVFSIPLIQKSKEDNFLSVEDRDDAIGVLNWRNLNRTKELVAQQLERRIQWWYLLAIILTCILLELSFLAIFFTLFILISPALNQMGWLLPLAQQNIIQNPIPQVAIFLASIQVAAFAANLLDKPKENILFKRTLEKAADWLGAIIVFQALYLPTAQIWESKKELPWHKKFGVTTLRAKVITESDITDEDVKEACEKLEGLFPRFQLVDFSVYRKNENLTQKLRFGVEDFQWKYINNRKLGKKQFTPISFELEIHEQHMLGKEKLLAKEEIPEKWFGSSKISQKIGKAIWDFDENHEVIMHPSVLGDEGKAVHVFINLFRKFRKSEEYSSLAHNLLSLVKELAPHATLISIVFYFRSGLNSKTIADLQWTSDGAIFYKDELKKKSNFLTPIFSLFLKTRKRTQKPKQK